MKKTNPWMLSSIFLFGLIVGFLLAKVLPAGSMGSGNNALAGEANTLANPSASGQTAAPPAAPGQSINYANIQSTKDQNGHFVLGNPRAKVTIEEYSDYQCPFCHKFFSENLASIVGNYIVSGKASYIFINSPLDKHPQASKAAESALCAGDQGKYWQMHDLLFKNQDSWSFQDTSIKTFQMLAGSLSLNMDQFNQCLQSSKYKNQIQKDLALSMKKEVSGTPTFYINGEKVVGAQPLEYFQMVIEDALKKQ